MEATPQRNGDGSRSAPAGGEPFDWGGPPPAICLVTAEYPPRVGGVGLAAQRLARYLVEEGCRVQVVAPEVEPGRVGHVQEHGEEDGARVTRVRLDARNPDEALRATCDLLRELDAAGPFDLFHGFFLSVVYSCVQAAGRPGTPGARPVVASMRGSDAVRLIHHPYLRPLILAGVRDATWVTSVNQAYLDAIGAQVPLTGRCSVIRNGVEVPPDVHWSLDAGNQGVVGTVGQFREAKDIPLLVRAYGAVSPRRRRRLLLAGFFSVPEEEAWSWTLADELGVRDQIVVTGQFPASAVREHLLAMHVYVQSSAHEGLPNSLLEAAALGVPLVSTDVGGLGEILTDGGNALVVPHGYPRRLADAIEQVLRDDGLARRLSEGARALAGSLDWSVERRSWLELYRRLLGRSGAAG